MPKLAMIDSLKAPPVIGACFDPFLARVLFETGAYFRGVKVHNEGWGHVMFLHQNSDLGLKEQLDFHHSSIRDLRFVCCAHASDKSHPSKKTLSPC